MPEKKEAKEVEVKKPEKSYIELRNEKRAKAIEEMKKAKKE